MPIATTITDGNGVANTYDEAPITEPVYETQTVYTDSSTPSSRNVQQRRSAKLSIIHILEIIHLLAYF